MSGLASEKDFEDFLIRVSSRPFRAEPIIWTSQRLANHLYDAETERLLPWARQAVAAPAKKRRYKFTPEQMRSAMRALEKLKGSHV